MEELRKNLTTIEANAAVASKIFEETFGKSEHENQPLIELATATRTLLEKSAACKLLMRALRARLVSMEAPLGHLQRPVFTPDDLKDSFDFNKIDSLAGKLAPASLIYL